MDQSVQEVAGQAQEKAGQAADQARSTVRDQVDQRSTEIGERVSTSASDVRSVAEELRKQGKDGPARLADQAAERAERVGGWLTEADGDRILHDIEDFSRRNTWAVAVGGLAIGFAASRLLKASSSQRYRSQSGGGSPTAGQLSGGTTPTSGASPAGDGGGVGAPGAPPVGTGVAAGGP